MVKQIRPNCFQVRRIKRMSRAFHRDATALAKQYPNGAVAHLLGVVTSPRRTRWLAEHIRWFNSPASYFHRNNP